jgi:hypothetical protein
MYPRTRVVHVIYRGIDQSIILYSILKMGKINQIFTVVSGPELYYVNPFAINSNRNYLKKGNSYVIILLFHKLHH